MKKSLLFAAAAIVLAAVSCTKENFVPVEGKTTLEVSLCDASKTYLDTLKEGSRKIYWLKGDKLAWNGAASEALGDEYTADAKLSGATFTWAGLLSKPCDILYPASFYTDATHITLPASQAASGKSDVIATDVLPMYGHIAASESAPALKGLCGLVKITWTLAATDPDSHNIKVIEFSGNAGEQVSGLFEIDYSTGALTSTSSADADKKVTVVVNTTATAEKAFSCLIAVPAGAYASGFKVKLIDEYGHYMEKSKSSSFTVEAGKVAVLPEFEFVPSATTITVITTASEWNEYAAAYNAGDYSDAVISADLDFASADSLNYITKLYQNTINGGNYKFQNANIRRALFSTIGPEGVVENIEFADSYSITNNSVAGTFGSLAIYLDGAISGIKFNGTMDFKYGDTGAHYLGGIVGSLRKSGKIENCEFNGSLTNSDDSGECDYQYVGGIVGSVYDDPTMTKTLKNCKFGGSIVLGDGSTSAGLTQTGTGLFRVGGIGGRFSCVNASNLETTAGSSIFVGGKFKSLSVGGIVADERAELSGCTNRANITVMNDNEGVGEIRVAGVVSSAASSTSGYTRRLENLTNEGAVSVISNSKYVFVGGVMSSYVDSFTPGSSPTTYSIYASNLTNNGSITTTGHCDTLFVGGIVAMDQFSKNCRTGNFVNTGDIVASNNAKKFTAVGGYTGCLTNNDIRTSNTAGTTAPSDLHKNTGTIILNVSDPSYSSVGGYAVAGGIAGFCGFSIVCDAYNKVLNQGSVTLNVSVDVPNNATARTSIGGIAGYLYRTSAKQFSYLSNSGIVSINYPDKDSKLEGMAGCAGFCCGGILGSCEGVAHNFDNLNNSGQINADGTKNGISSRTAYLGGILGKAFGAYAYSIKNCTNSGGIYSHVDGSSSTVANRVCAGGILGYGKGNAFKMKDATARDTSKVFAIYDCVCSGAGSSTTNGQIYSYRGNTGGILGFGDQYIHVLRCENHKIIAGGNGYNAAGGIVGYLNTYSAVDYCTVDSKVSVGTTSANAFAAGIVGNGGTSQYYSITHCTYDNADGVKGCGGAYLLVGMKVNTSSYTAIPCGSIIHCAVRGKVTAGNTDKGTQVATVADASNFLDLARPAGSGAATTGTHFIAE